MDLGLEDKVAVVTGASKGLGRAIAGELVAEGARVAICSRDDAEIKTAAEELRAQGGAVHAEAADVTEPEDIERFMAASADALGGIDVLVNNAGRATPGTFATLDDDALVADLELKLLSQIRCSRAAHPYMRSRGGGRIININAIFGRQPDPAFFATSVNRAACLAFTKTLAMELAADGILVNSVNIGFVVTPQWENIHRRRAPDVEFDRFLERLAAEEVPMRRFGRPDEVAGIVAFLAGERASYITGASIDVSGGMGRYV
jgi:NAD(P)-dependent dehydrogenase (short-subunit alcohol dehydrogenase family)